MPGQADYIRESEVWIFELRGSDGLDDINRSGWLAGWWRLVRRLYLFATGWGSEGAW